MIYKQFVYSAIQYVLVTNTDNVHFFIVRAQILNILENALSGASEVVIVDYLTKKL